MYMDIVPMEPILKKSVKEGNEWIHEIKWDGIRGICYINGDSLHLFSKNGIEKTSKYPEIKNIINLFKGRQCILDGELVVFDNDNKPTFNEILIRDRVKNPQKLDYYKKQYPVYYIIYDILYYNNEDLRRYPLIKRKEILISNMKKSSHITITDYFNNGHDLLNLMKEKNYEGIVSKKINSYYISGKKHTDWIKVKLTKKMLVVVGGVKLKNNLPNALLVGIYRDNKLMHISNVSIGLTQKDVMILKNQINYLAQKNSPFHNLQVANGVVWFKPILTLWISFLEWTNDFNLRHPQIIGFSNINPKEAYGKEYSK